MGSGWNACAMVARMRGEIKTNIIWFAVIVIALLVGLYIFWSVLFFTNGNADGFQRLGSFGVALAIIYFLLIRRVLTSVDDLQARVIFAEIQHAQLWENLAAVANKLRIVIAVTTSNDPLLRNRLLEELTALSAELQEIPLTDLQKLSESKNDELDDELRGRSKHSKVSKLLVMFSVVEALILVVATLQWGYGDLLVDWLYG